MADPDFELRRGPGFNLLAQPAFLPSVISSFFTQNKGGGGPCPSPGSATDFGTNLRLDAVTFKNRVQETNLVVCVIQQKVVPLSRSASHFPAFSIPDILQVTKK